MTVASAKTGPVLTITPAAYEKMMAWVAMATGEVSGLGQVEELSNNEYRVTEVFLLKQECTASNTEMDDEAVHEFMTWCKEQKIPGESIKLMWHSHGNMGTSWSLEDEKCVAAFGCDFMFGVVVNKAKDRLARLDIHHPRGVHVSVTGINLEIVYDSTISEELMEKLKAEFEDKVTIKAYNTFASSHGRKPKNPTPVCLTGGNGAPITPKTGGPTTHQSTTIQETGGAPSNQDLLEAVVNCEAGADEELETVLEGLRKSQKALTIKIDEGDYSDETLTLLERTEWDIAELNYISSFTPHIV